MSIMGEPPSTDRLSELPDPVIVKILSMMPINDSCKTIVFSKKWKSFWTHTDNVVFGWDIDWSYVSDLKSLITSMDNALDKLNCPKIEKFHLQFNFDRFMGFRSKLDNWLGVCVKKGVKDVALNVQHADPNPYSLPLVLCMNSSLEKLACWNCKLTESCVLKWISLKSLTLDGLMLTDNHITKIISGCPQLEHLEISDSTGFRRMDMSSSKCRRLQLIDHETKQSGNDHCIELIVPNVAHLMISGDLGCSNISLKGVSSLHDVELTFKFYDASRESGEELEREKLKSMVEHILKNIRCANKVTILSWFAEVLAMLETEGFQFSLPDCRRLVVKSSLTPYALVGLGFLVRSAPQLEELEVDESATDDSFTDSGTDENLSDRETDENRSDSEKYDDFWQGEDPDGELLARQGEGFEGSAPNLKTVKIISKWCNGEDTSAPVHELMEILSNPERGLKKLVIASSHSGCKRCLTAILAMAALRCSHFASAYNRGVVSIEN